MSAMSSSAAPVELRCESLVDPLGLGEPEPRLSWVLSDRRHGARQVAYQVQVAASSQALVQGKPDVWDSGRVQSAHSIHVPYGGAALRSRQAYSWRVRVWDQSGQASDWSRPARWEMGLLERGDWRAQWVGTSLVGSPRTTAPCPYLRKPFRLERAVTRARLYITALGLYEASLNGRRVGDGVFRPGWTDYARRVQYDTHDVTELLRGGEKGLGDNVLGAILGDGWYCGHVGPLDRQFYGDRPCLLAQLEIDTDDGRRHLVATDGSWTFSDGPICESDMIMGESYDARRELPGWDAPGFDAAAWAPVQVVADPGVAIVSSPAQPVRRQEELVPIAEPVRSERGWIFDLGQNMAGWVRLRVKAPAGKTIRLRFAEMLDRDGSLYRENLRSARASDFYTCRGDGEEAWEPRFTFHGFRYVEVAGLAEPPTRRTITGIVVHSDTPATGSFECSDELLNQLQRCIRWGQKGNFIDVPTDCPQRDERLGWTGDAQIFIPTACFNADVAAFFTKWQQDLADGQHESGGVPMVAPAVLRGGPPDAGPAWSDAIVICPWTIWRHYGDRRLLERHYDSLKRYVHHLRDSAAGGIRVHALKPGWEGFGDWVAVDHYKRSITPTPKDLIGTAYFARCLQLMIRIAHLTGHEQDVGEFEALRAHVVEAFRREFITPGGRVAGNSQTAYALALMFDLLTPDQRELAERYFLKTVSDRDWHLWTGFVGTPLLLPALSACGHTDDAYRVLRQRDYPGWLLPVLNGATTMWERWNSYTREHGFGDAGMNSFNHYAYGAVGEWMYATIAGIRLHPDVPAYQHSVIRPEPGGGLSWAKASLKTPYGVLATHWRQGEGTFELDLTVPPNARGTVHLPVDAKWKVDVSPAENARRDPSSDDVTYDVPSGEYRFVCRAPAG